MKHAIIKKGTTDGIRAYALECRLSETFMDVPQLSVKVSSPSVIDFKIGDYIVFDYNGVTYTLRETPEKSKNARPQSYGGAFVYNLIFYGPEWDLRNAPFRDLVEADNVQHFTSMPDVTTYEDVYGIAARVQACMDDMYPGKWSIRVVSGLSSGSALAQRLSETQDFSLSDGKCLDALSQVYSQWGVSFVYSYEDGMHVITIGGAETQEDTSGLFMYGKGNGLKVIKASVQNASELATRLFVYGGTQNMQPRYYNGRTMEPEYIHASDASNSTITGICSGRRLLGDNMYVPNLMIPVPKWGRTTWYVWTASSHSQPVFTEVRNPSAGDDFAFREPNIGASRNVISSVSSDSIVVGGVTYQYLTVVLYPDIRKAYIDAPQSYLDKYGIRPATLRFDGSGGREDIHPSIKGLTIGDIRAGLGSEAEYYPETSVYTDPDERVDEVLSCDNPQDDGLTSSGENKYTDILTANIAQKQITVNVDNSYPLREEDDPVGGGTVTYDIYKKDYVYLLKDCDLINGIDGKLSLRSLKIPLVLSTDGVPDKWQARIKVILYKKTSLDSKDIVAQYIRVFEFEEQAEMDVSYTYDAATQEYISSNGSDVFGIDVILDKIFIYTEYDIHNPIPFKITVNSAETEWKFSVSLGAQFYIKLRQIGFDISEVPTNDGESPVISMTSGQCGGYEFEIHDVSYNASDDSWTLRCARVQDGTLGQWFPNSIFKIEPDDTFVLLNIALPEVYITANEQRLYDAALAERLYEERPLLEPEIDSKVMAESPQVLRAGMWFSVKDTDLGLTGADGGSFLILIDSVEVTDKPDTIRSFKVTLRNNKEDNVFVRMQRQIAQTSAFVQSERRGQTKTSVSEVPTKSGGGGEYIDTSDFVTLSTDQTITGKKTFANDVVFGGAVSEGVYGKLLIPSTAGPGIYGLLVSDEPVQGEVPSGSGGLDKAELWLELGGTPENPVIGKDHLPGDTVYTDDLAGYALKSELPDLTPYATQEWVTGQGYATQTWVKGRGYLTATDADGRYVNIAGDTMTGSLHGTDIELSGHISAATLYVPYSGGNKIYSLKVGDGPVSGEAPSGGGGLDSAALWEELGGNATDKVIGLSRIPDIPVDMVSGLLGNDSRILPSLLPDWLMGQLLYGGTVDGSSVATVSAAFKDRYGTGGDTVTLNASNASQYEGVYFIASADASSGVVQSLGVRTGDWVVSNGLAWTKIDNTDSVSSVAGLTGIIGKAALQTALSDSTHRFVTDAQTAAWDGKWAWDEEDIKAVKVDAAVLADKAKALNAARSLWGQSFDGTGDVDGNMSGVGGITMSGSIAGAVNADFSGYLSAGTLYVPYSGGSKVYSLKVSDAPVSGESPSGGGGMDADALWLELGGSTDDKVIAKSHLPEDTVYEGDLAGYALKSEIPSLAGYATQSWVQSQGYLKSVSLATISDLHSSWDAVLKAQKPAWLTTVSLSTISDLHSSWDALLKAQKPTTLAGYGITNAYTQTEVNAKLAAYLPLAGGTMSGAIRYVSNGNRYLTLSDAGLHWDFSDVTVGHAQSWLYCTEPDGSGYTGMGVYGTADGLNYIYLGGSYTAPWITLRPSGNVGIGVTSPSYRLHVVGNSYATGDMISSSFSLNGGSGVFTFNSSTDSTWLQGKANKNFFISGLNDTTLPQLSLKASDTYAMGDFRVGGSLFIPSTSGNKVYSLKVSDAPVSGESPSAGGGGLDVDAMWDELAATDASKVIDASHIPLLDMEKVNGLPTALSVVNASLNAMSEALHDKADISDIPSLSGYINSVTTSGAGNAVTGYAKSGNTLTLVKGTTFLTSVPKATSSAYGGIKIGYPESGKNYPVELDSSGRAYVSVPWVNTTYSLSSFGITATAAEINKLDGVGTLLHSGNYTSYTVTKTGGGASGTWGINISGNAATADVSNYLFLNPNNGTHASQNDAVPANGRFAIYDVNTAITAGGNDGYIMAFRWPSGNFVTQVFLDADNTGIMALRHRSSSNVWTDWYRILHSDNIGSYALTKSNYASTLDSRYVKKAGDTMTGILNISSSSDALIRYQISGSNKAASGYHASRGAYLYSYPAGKDLHITDSGSLLFDSSTVWHSGNDGSGSGLDADLLDGYHSSSFFRRVDGAPTNDYSFGLWEGVGSYASFVVSNYGGQLRFTLRPSYRYIYPSYNPTWNEIAFLTDNVASATKLQTSRTLWGQSFNGTGNVSGNMTGVGSISGATFGIAGSVGQMFLYNNTSKNDKRLTLYPQSNYAAIYNITADGSAVSDLVLGNNINALYYDASAASWGIGTTSPAYKLDVAGEIRATSGITIGSTDDYGWYISTGTRISAGVDVARGVNVGSLLVSNAWADYTKVPTNGIYSKGNILSAGNIIAYSSSSRLVKDILPKRTTFSQRLNALGSVVDYRYNNVLKRDRDAHIGLIYENVRDAMPGMCYTHEGYGALNYLDTDYINLVAGAVQEHTDEIVHLKNKVASLEAEVTRLRRGLAA